LHEDFLIKVADSNPEEQFVALAHVIKKYITPEWLAKRHGLVADQKKTAYYFSIEFLPGRMLETNLLNLGLLDLVKDTFNELGLSYPAVVEFEKDMALGNGGLGRLAAAFMDSLASIGASGFGNGIRYKYGLFKQRFVNGYQIELPDSWLGTNGSVWETKKPHAAVDVQIYGNVYLKPTATGDLKPVYENAKTLHAVPYDVPQIGFQNGTINNLRLWDIEIPEEYELEFPTVAERRHVEDITATLYPDDSTLEGRKLRLIQEYFMTSAGLQTIIRSYLKMGLPLKDIHEKVSVHINDTHPAVAVAEFMRLLVDEHDLTWEEAWHATVETMSYTNHTILAEALEKWDVPLFREVVPRVYQICLEIDRRFVQEMSGKGVDPTIIENTRPIKNNQVHMANLAIIGGHSVNGVAKLHTDLLKEDALHDFYVLYPEKFNNKTNGIVVRRWTQIANPEMSSLLDKVIGPEWRHDIHLLKKLEEHIDNPSVIADFQEVKKHNKQRLAAYIMEKTGIEVSTDAIFDVQVKRLHAYKRQLLNAMHILKLYLDLKDNPDLDMVPRVFIFGAKAAPGYHFAKSVIKYINEMAATINNDASIKGKLKVVFLENYNVTLAEHIIPASDVSEQISTAGKEASGTSNMKFMMSGALTLATLDGANIEIKDAVGDENIVIFGMNKEQVYEHYMRHDYVSRDVYQNNPVVKRVLDCFVTDFIPNTHYEGQEIFDALINQNDEYFLLEDFKSYIEAQETISNLYKDQTGWTKKTLMNIANSGKFSADDTIRLYCDEIWNLDHN
jgi:starch phosphorylase